MFWWGQVPQNQRYSQDYPELTELPALPELPLVSDSTDQGVCFQGWSCRVLRLVVPALLFVPAHGGCFVPHQNGFNKPCAFVSDLTRITLGN